MRVLVVATLFPPERSARAIQAGKLVSALSASGLDVRLIAGVPSVVPPLAPVAAFPARYVPLGAQRGSTTWSRGIHVLRETAKTMGWTPWANRAVEAGSQLLQGWSPRVVLSLSSPFDAHRAGARLAEIAGCPWVAFFSDPYPLGLLPSPYRDSEISFLTWLQKRESERVLPRAKVIIAPTIESAQVTAAVVDPATRPDLAEVPHIGTEVPPRAGEPCIIHAGDLTRQRTSAALRKGLIAAVKELEPSGARLEFIGSTDAQFRSSLESELTNSRSMAEFRPRADHGFVAQRVASARVLLIVEADSVLSPFVPSKLADYMLTGRPIVAISPLGSALRRFAQGFAGLFFAEHDAEQVHQAVRSAWYSALQGPAADAAQFRQSQVAERYRRILASACGEID